MPEITIASANVDSPEWAELLVKSIRKFTKLKYEILIIDNGSLPENKAWLRKQKDVRLLELNFNSKHGGALDMSVEKSKADHVCFIDIDAHMQRFDWEKDLFDLYESDKKIKLIGVRGPDIKPLHPPLFFFERKFILKHKISFQHVPPYSTDTAQKAYWDILALGFKVERLGKGKKIYDCRGDEVYLSEQPTFYHHWNGTRFCENRPGRTKTVVGFGKFGPKSLSWHLENKTKLFQQDLVKEILSDA